MSTDLFGNEVPDVPLSQETSRRITNDMGQVMAALERACAEHGYVVSVLSRKVFRRVDKEKMRSVPVWESTTVLQLLDRGLLNEGGTHLLRCGAVRSGVRSVLVPKSSRQMLSRWKALKTPPSWNATVV
ncbi:hypothetical protein ACQPW3_39590 [Actinosynnema sp. CA-248983]